MTPPRKRTFAPAFRLSPQQARTVAVWRLDDARYLRDSGRPKHLNGAVYLGGLALDCFLKAHLLEKHPWLQTAEPSSLKGPALRRWNLVYRLHDLDGLLGELPDVLLRLQTLSTRGSPRLDMMLRNVCLRWSIHVRYLPERVDTVDARRFLNQVEELKPWL